MIDVREADEAAAARWATDRSARLREWYGAYSDSPAWVDSQVAQRLREAGDGAVFHLYHDEQNVGTLALAVVVDPSPSTALREVFVRPEYRRRGYATAALAWATAWARDRTARLVLSTDAADPAHATVFAGIPVRAQNMLIKLSTSDGDGVPAGAVAMTEPEFTGWRSERVREYAAQMARSGLLSAADAQARADAQFDQLLPAGVATQGQDFWCLHGDGGEVIAAIWLGHGHAPDTSWVYSVDVVAHRRGTGLGRAAMLVGQWATRAAGNHQVGLNVFAHNTVAVRLYDGMGYRVFQQHRSLDLADVPTAVGT